MPLRPAPKDAAPMSLNPIIAKNWHKKDPVDFFSNARPRAETTNQTMSMVGHYSADMKLSKHLGLDRQRCHTAPVQNRLGSTTGL